jgi:Cu(I)/Ag(I) efflux system membrane fusion protein
MQRIPPYYLLAIIVVVLAVGIVIGRWMGGPSGRSHSAAPTEVVSAEPETWTCSMHPQIQTPEPGDCPICGMDLIPVDKGSGNELGPRALAMSESALALAEIQTTEVVRAFSEVEVNLVGRLELDETRVRSLTARFPARIDELFVNYTGAPVKAGEHLAIVYSPELSTAQHELIMAYQADPEGSLAIAAREKLRLWDLLPDQIEAIIERGEASDNFELRAPIGGVVVAKNVNEGDYVTTGQSLLKIADLGVLWLFLDAYESDMPWLRFGQEVEFTVEAWPGETFNGQIAFIEPELDRMTRTVAVRVNVPNGKARLKPGMFARGIVRTTVAEGGKVHAPDMAGKWISPMHPEIVKDAPGQCDVCGMDLVPAESLGYVDLPVGDAPLVVPASAVLRTGKRAVVYVRIEDAEEPTFEGREIVLGPRAGDVFLVQSGLSEGERVVTRGAFKLDSALQIQAKPSMMNPG